MLSDEIGIGFDESFKYVEKLRSFFNSRSASCADYSCSMVTVWVEDKALMQESVPVPGFTLPYTCRRSGKL